MPEEQRALSLAAEAGAVCSFAQLLWILHSSSKLCGGHVNPTLEAWPRSELVAGLVISPARINTWLLSRDVISSFKETLRNDLDKREVELCILSRQNKNRQGCLNQ